MQVKAVVHGAKKLQREMVVMDRRVDRATMWTVREAGRDVKREAKRTAPVWKGRGRSVSQKQAKTGGLAVNPHAPVRGLYKASIGSSKKLARYGPGVYGNKVAPRGFRVHFYSSQVEAKHHVMEKALNHVRPRFRAIGQRAYARATRR